MALITVKGLQVPDASNDASGGDVQTVAAVTVPAIIDIAVPLVLTRNPTDNDDGADTGAAGVVAVGCFAINTATSPPTIWQCTSAATSAAVWQQIFPQSATVPPATDSSAGTMSAADKTKLDNLAASSPLVFSSDTFSISPATDSTPGSMSAADKTKLDSTGAAGGIATLDGSGKLSSSQIPAALVGALDYQGTWSASTNSPTLASGVGTKGFYYKVSVAGSTAIDGTSAWIVGDWIVFDGSVWDKIDGNPSEVISVAGRTGAVVLTGADVPAATDSTAGTMSAADKTKLDAATNANTASTLVARDASGNFSSGTITVSGSGASSGVTGLATPVGNTDAVSLGYITNLLAGLNNKADCASATTSALDGCTYANGASGVGATLTSTAHQAINNSGSIDGIAVSVGQRVLVKNQASAIQNGIYTVTVLGNGVTSWVLTRSIDLDVAAQFPGSYVFVEGGTTNGGFFFWTNPGNPTIGTTAITWTQLPGVQLAAGTGIAIAGGSISVDFAFIGGIYYPGSANQLADSTDLYYPDGSTLAVAEGPRDIPALYYPAGGALLTDGPGLYDPTGALIADSAGVRYYSTGQILADTSNNLFCPGTFKAAHISGNSALGVPTVVKGAALGTGGSAGATLTGANGSGSASDTAGMLKLTTGTTGVTGGVAATVTFASAFASPPIVTLTPANSNAANPAGPGFAYVSSSSTTGFVVSCGQSPANGSTVYEFGFVCIGAAG